MPNDPLVLWNHLVACYRDACRHELLGDAGASRELLEKQVTPAAAAWARVVPLTGAEKRTVLRGLFLDQRLRVQKHFAAVKPVAQTPFNPKHGRPTVPAGERAAIVNLIDDVQAGERLAS